MSSSKAKDPFMVSVAIQALSAITMVYDIVTYIPCYLYYYSAQQFQNRIKALPFSGNVAAPWRFVDNEGKLAAQLNPNCFTLDEEFERVADLYSECDCLGTREVLSEEDERVPSGKIFKKLILGEYKWKSFKQVYHEMDNFGKGLTSLDLKPKQNILIFAETRAEFLISLQACFRYNFPVVTLYATLGEEAIKYGINEAEVTHIITSSTLLEKLKVVQAEIPSVKHIIYMEDQLHKVDHKKMVFSNGIKLHTFNSVVEMGKLKKEVVRVKTTANDLAVIMYTSGSTGKPKGVMISHGNMLAMITGAVRRINAFGTGDTCVCYLPLAHVLELAVELAVLSFGSRIGYSSALTLTDMSSKIKKGSKGDVTMLQPTLMAAVPLIMERLYKAVMDKVSENSALKKALFHFAYNYKLKQLSRGFDTPIFNRIIFSKLKEQLGGKMRVMVSGGAALSSSAQRFMNACFCCPIVQGYGLTETCGGGTVSELGDNRTSHVGPPLCCNYIKLVDWKEGNYLVSDKPNPRGEVLIGGNNITMGYYKNPKLTNTVFEEIDGIRWFYTGDIGEFQPDGTLKIIDRKKDLVKLQTGEYISLQSIESVLKKSPYIENVCIYADGAFDYVIALIVPYRKAVMDAATQHGLEGKSWEDICANRDIERIIHQSIQNECREAKLQKWEVPKKLKLCVEAWTPDSGLVTDAFKLKRKPLKDFYNDSIKRLYGK